MADTKISGLIRVRAEGFDETVARFRRLRAEEVPFIAALSLTRTGQVGQTEVREGLGARFTLRRRAFLEAGVRIVAASKRNLEVTVRDVDPFMDLQEEGGSKSAGSKYKLFSYQGKVCIPLKGARRRAGALVPKEDYPEAVMNGGGFMARGFIRANSSGVAIMYRVFRVRKRATRLRGMRWSGGSEWKEKVQPMYALVDAWDVKQRWNFVQTVIKAAETFPANFEREWAARVKD